MDGDMGNVYNGKTDTLFEIQNSGVWTETETLRWPTHLVHEDVTMGGLFK